MKDKIPDEKSWKTWFGGKPVEHFELKYAHDMFAGKTIKEDQPNFYDNALSASEAISYMPPVPFQYYIFAFAEFVSSTDLTNPDAVSNEATCGASSFLLLVKDKLEKSPGVILPVMDELMPVVEYVATRQVEFQAQPFIFGSFEDLLLDIRHLNAGKKMPRERSTPSEFSWDGYRFFLQVRDKFKNPEMSASAKNALMPFVEDVASEYLEVYGADPEMSRCFEYILAEIRQLNASDK